MPQASPQAHAHSSSSHFTKGKVRWSRPLATPRIVLNPAPAAPPWRPCYNTSWDWPAQAHPSPSCFAKSGPNVAHPTRNYPGPGLFQLHQPSWLSQEHHSLGITTSPTLQLKPLCQGCLSSALVWTSFWLMPTPVLLICQSFQVQAV